MPIAPSRRTIAGRPVAAALALALQLGGCRSQGPSAAGEHEAEALPGGLPDWLIVQRQALETRLAYATMAGLRLRRALLSRADPTTVGWLGPLDVQLQRLVAAQCGDEVTERSRTVRVAATPVDQLFPVALVPRATAAYCGGLRVGDAYAPGPAWTDTGAALDPPRTTMADDDPDNARSRQLAVEVQARLRQVVLLTLRERAELLARHARDTATRVRQVDGRLGHLVVALCGDTVATAAGTLHVAAASADQLFPLEQLDRATSADCTGLVVDGEVLPGPLLRSMAARATRAAP